MGGCFQRVMNIRLREASHRCLPLSWYFIRKSLKSDVETSRKIPWILWTRISQKKLPRFYPRKFKTINGWLSEWGICHFMETPRKLSTNNLFLKFVLNLVSYFSKIAVINIILLTVLSFISLLNLLITLLTLG